jgi:signal transduction histidine kinase
MMHRQTEKELIEKGEVLTQEMNAVWSFMAANQDQLQLIAYSETGSYKGLHCAIVGRSVGLIFSRETNYTTRFVNFNPRNLGDTPDDFESQALTAFLENPEVSEYYAFTEYDGMGVFRYSAPMNIEENCLECHGEPKGELDMTGAPKEGWKIGDVGGAISIVIPLDVYIANEQDTNISNLIFFGALLLFFVICVWFALSKLVTRPLSNIQAAVQTVQGGDLDIQLPPSAASREIKDLVSEFNNMSDELAEIYNRLEEQVESRTVELSEANQKLESQRLLLEDINEHLTDENRYKSDFLAMMSHELRTPLTSIIAFAGMLEEKARQEPEILRVESAESSSIREICREIEASSQLLLTIINDILEMSRIDAGKAAMNVECVDFGDLIALVQSSMWLLAEQKQLALSYTVEGDVPLINADFDKLQHILVNLISNAIKFTPEGGNIQVAISFDRSDQCVSMRVTDNGIGIEKANQKAIFDRFKQIDSSMVRQYNGTGLGLGLVREYANMHGGSVTVKSEVGKGSTFTVCIPTVLDLTEETRDEK